MRKRCLIERWKNMRAPGGCGRLPGGPLKRQVSLNGGKRQSLGLEVAGFLWSSSFAGEAEAAVAWALTSAVPWCLRQTACALWSACPEPWESGRGPVFPDSIPRNEGCFSAAKPRVLGSAVRGAGAHGPWALALGTAAPSPPRTLVSHQSRARRWLHFKRRSQIGGLQGSLYGWVRV